MSSREYWESKFIEDLMARYPHATSHTKSWTPYIAYDGRWNATYNIVLEEREEVEEIDEKELLELLEME